MGECSLTTNCFLECSACSSSAINFSIKETNVDELAGECEHVRSHNIWCVSSGETPDDITGSITHMSTHTMVAKIDVIDERFLQDWNKFGKSLREKQASPT